MAPLAWQQSVFDKLIELRLIWLDADSPPSLVAALSRGEYVALALASGYAHLLKDPVDSFLYLDGWLQSWVLYQRGQARYVGQRIGFDQD